jgi:GT2 family glycosyltransferase/glycosyltransferase involved in cell wall biosynthesis
VEAVVDVIIPVYRGVEETRRCLEAVLAAPQCTPFELIVVDDASPEPAIRAQLDELAAAGCIRLLRHARNLGFVAAVNAGLALHPERDLVLLNSDTEVSGDWLDRLCAHAEAEPCVGTVTPFSNDASLCSYPRIAESNAMPFDSTPAELDALAARINAGRSIDLPTGVGFCLLIRREALDQVGGFDVERFGLGYGEEVDVCLRLEQAGYRHLLAGDVFVYHQGSVSFGAQAEQRKQRAQALIDAEYPDYQQRIQAFFAQDAGRPLRRRLDIARLRGIHPLVLFVCHDRGGGVERHVGDLTELLRGQVEVLVLQPHGPRLQRLIWSRDEEEFTVYLDLAQGYAEAIELLEALCIDRLHYHHVADFPIEVLKLPRDLDRPYDFTLHDFAVVCPQFHFATAQGRYCGERGLAHCRPCLTERPPPWPLQIEQWRVLWQDWLAAAERIICPSQDARARLARYWPALSSLHWPHPEPARLTWGNSPLSRQPPVKVLVLGAISAIKGFDLVDACARDARQRDLPLFFRVLGPSAPSNAPWPESLLSIAGGYRDADLPDLIAAERPDVFFFPSQVPETFSYTLSMAMQTGWPILATRLGAFSERLAEYPLAQLLDPEAPVADWNQALLSCQPRDVTWCSGSKAARAAESYGQEYSARYLEVFSNQEICSVQEPLSDTFVLPAHQVFVSPEDQPPEPSLSQLYSGVVEYRDWRLQSELTRRIEETELALADAQWERRELRVQLNNEKRAHALYVKHLHARINAIYTSTTWRLINPLMGLARPLRELGARWREWLRTLRR